MNVVSYAWQDLSRNRTRTMFAISGVLISIFLLTSVSILNDSLSYSYVNMATNQAGASDIVFTRSLAEVDINIDFYFDETIIPEKLANVDKINHFYPRLMMPVQVDRWDKEGTKESIFFYGIDVASETINDDIGDLWELDQDFKRVAKFSQSIPSGHCIILEATAKRLNVTVGDVLHCTYTKYQADFIIDAVCEQDMKFSLIETNLIITDLPVAQEFMHLEGKINNVMATLKNPELIYDSRNYDLTMRRLRAIGQEIQDEIGFDYQVTLPKLAELELSQYIMTGVSTMFWFITFLAMLITGILINGILSTSVEERIREFGIFRTLGSRKFFNLKLVLLEGLLISLLGTAFGILLAVSVVPWILPIIFTTFHVWTQEIPFVVLPESVLLSLAIGVTISVAVSAFPALKTSRIKITDAIQPFKQEHGQYKIQKEGSAKAKFIIAGASIATVGAIIFVIFPRVIVSGDIELIVSVFVGLLFAILIGLVFASVAVIPAIEKGFSYMFKPLVGRFLPIVQTSLKRYKRRNTSTVVMFAIAFAFIFFITTRIELDSQNIATNFRFQYGADIVLVNRGETDSGHALTKALADEIAKQDSVAKTATTSYNTFDVQSIMAMFDIAGEGTGGDLSSVAEGIDENTEFDQSGTSPSGNGGGMGLMGGMGMMGGEGGSFNIAGFFGGPSKYTVRVGDLADINEFQAGLVGIDEDFVQLADPNLFMWAEGSGMDSLQTIIDDNQSCIVSVAAADYLMKDVGDQVRFRVYNESKSELNATDFVFTIAGISGGIPGYWNFRSSAFTLWGSGVMINMDAYAEIMDWWDEAQIQLDPEFRDESQLYVDKIFITLKDHDTDSVKDFKAYIDENYGDKYSYLLDDAITYINMNREQNKTISTIMEIILMFTVVICLFGLLSSMYATILERTLEIGIVRAMGMKAFEVRRMFLVESMCTMLAAGIMGTVIGSVIAYLLASQTALLTEVPVLFTPPWGTIFRVFFISISLCIVGMYGILRQ
ncbi:MAG: ABC transporter permease, partial [Promethearchaeota archaeon]